MSDAAELGDLATRRLHTMLSDRVANMLGRKGIDTVAALMNYHRSDLEAIRGFGPLTMAEIDDALVDHGLCLTDHDAATGPTLAEKYRTVLDQRDQLLALIERIAPTVSTPHARADITATVNGINFPRPQRDRA